MKEIVEAQKEEYRKILKNTKETHNAITNFNQQNREYYSLRFSEVQKDLTPFRSPLLCINQLHITFSIYAKLRSEVQRYASRKFFPIFG